MLHRKIQQPYHTQKHRQRRKTTITPGLRHFTIQLCKKNKQNGIRTSDICLVPGGGVTGDTVLNVMRGIGYAKDKKAEIAENNRVAVEVTKAAYISKQMTLGKDTVEKLAGIEDNNKNSGGCGKFHQAKGGRNFGGVWK